MKIYFQPKGINPLYCEVGIILDSDKEHIHYLEEPCKILISEVKIIDEKNVTYNKRNKLYYVNQTTCKK